MSERQRDAALEASTTRWMAGGVTLTVLFVLMFPLYRLYEPSGRAEARAELSASLTAQGDALYQANCASCHGADGQGVDAPALNSQQFFDAADDTQIRSLIAHGVPGTEMAAYSLDFGGFLTSEQIEAITTYLRSLEADAPDRPDWRSVGAEGGHDEEPADDHAEEEPATTDEPADDHAEEEPATTDEPTSHDEAEEQGVPAGDDAPQAFDAAATYAGSCARCHAADLSGGTGPALGPSSHSLTEPDVHLAEAIALGRKEMPSFGSELTAEEIEEIVRFIRQIQSGD